MKKNISLFVALILALSFLYSQNTKEETPLFEQGVSHFHENLRSGDPRASQRADSIFNLLKSHGDFASKGQELATDLYLLRMEKGGSPHDKLARVSDLLDKYKDNGVDAPQLHDMLLYYRQRFRFQAGETDAEERILQLLAHQLDQKEPNHELLAFAYDHLSRGVFRKGNYIKAAQYGEKAMTHYKKAGFQAMYIATLQFTGGCYHWMDEVELSLQYMEQAYGLIKTMETPDPLRLSQLAFNIALINAGQLANKQKSIAYFKESIHYQSQARGETDFSVMLYSLLADVYFELKDLEQAEYYAQKGYVLANDVLKTESVYYRSLPAMSQSRILSAQGDHESARRAIDKVVEESIAFFGENDKFTVQAFNDKARVELEAKNHEGAKTYLLRAIQASENIDRIYSKLSAYKQLCDLYLETKDYDRAVATAKIIQKLDKEALEGDYISAADTNLALAEGYMGLKALDSATHHIKAAKNVLDQVENDADIIVKLRALSLETALLLEKYKLENSTAHLERAYENVDVLIKDIVAGKASFKYNTSKLYYSESIVGSINVAMEVCDSKYRLTQDPRVLNTIFTLMELNKSSILLDGINEMELKNELGVPETLIVAEAKVEKRLADLNKEIYALDKRSQNAQEEINQLIDQRLHLNKSLDSIHAVLREEHPKYIEAVEFKETGHLREYQKNLIAGHQALVEYYINGDIVHRITLTKNSIAYDKIVPEAGWKNDISEFYDRLTQQKELAPLSSQLGDLLLPEFPSDIDDIIFVLDGPLNQIPFEVLQYRGAYLIKDHSINYAGSLQLYEKQMKIGEQHRFNWIGFAPTYEETPLFDNKEEVLSINNIVDGTPILGAEATKQNLVELGEKASVIHLATHTELDKLNPMFNKILFSQDGISNELTTSEIYGLDLGADLAVLSACNTGTGHSRGDGVMSMSRAFTYAGTSSTVMSLWKVPDRQTSELMVLFYEFLEKGQTKSEALANAKLGYLEQVKYQELAHPFYWAGFVLSGADSPIPISKPLWKRARLPIALLLALSIPLAFVYYKKKKNGPTP